MNTNQAQEIITAATNAYHDGNSYARIKKLDIILPAVLQGCPGSFVEIGALHGQSTCKLCEHGKRVLVIDPWNGCEAGTESVYESFMRNTAQYNNLEVLRHSSYSVEAAMAIARYNPISFVLVDAEHTFNGTLKNLSLVSGASMICVDDVDRYDVFKAVTVFLSEHKEYEWLFSHGTMEAYLVGKWIS